MLSFYKKEAEESVAVQVDYLLKKENFDKIHEAYQAKKDKGKTQEDVDQYNDAVNALNEASNKSNEAIQQLNTKRTNLINKWNKTVESFLGRHIPKR